MRRSATATLALFLTIPALGLLALTPGASAGWTIPCIAPWPVPCDSNGNFPIESVCRGDPTPQVWVVDAVKNYAGGDQDLGPIAQTSHCYS